jgi:hypothetical protein
VAIDDLCFLLRSPLFLHAIAPRLRRATTTSEANAIGLKTPDSLVNGNEKEYGIDTSALNMRVTWDGDSWATRLLYGDSSLIEGRQYNTTKKASFVPSFHRFCEEARFLSCEFHAREHAAMVTLGTAVDSEPTEVEVDQTRVGSEGNKQRRMVKLKIRYKIARGRPVLVKKAS